MCAAHTGKLNMKPEEGWLVWQVMLMPIHMPLHNQSHMISAESEFLVCFKVLVQGFLLATITMQVFSDTVEYIKFSYRILWLFNYSSVLGVPVSLMRWGWKLWWRLVQKFELEDLYYQISVLAITKLDNNALGVLYNHIVLMIWKYNAFI